MTSFRRLSVLAALAALAAGNAAAEDVGLIALAQGDVKVDGQRATNGQPVKEGSTVATGDGKASVFLGGGSIVHLDRDTTFQVKKFGADAGGGETGELELKKGKARGLFGGSGKKKIRIETRTAVMGVRGTDVILVAPEDPDDPAELVLKEGSADVSLSGQTRERMPEGIEKPKPVLLQPGQVLRVRSGRRVEGGLSKLDVVSLSRLELRAYARGVSPGLGRVENDQDLAKIEESPDEVWEAEEDRDRDWGGHGWDQQAASGQEWPDIQRDPADANRVRARVTFVK
jgi:hypothetical protein